MIYIKSIGSILAIIAVLLVIGDNITADGLRITKHDIKNSIKEKNTEIIAAVYSEEKETQQSGKIDKYLTINNTLRDVTFCKIKTLKTRQIFINGIDVVQRIANIISNNLKMTDADGYAYGQRVCDAIPSKSIYTKGILETRDVIIEKGGYEELKNKNDTMYIVNIGPMMYAISPQSGAIFEVGGFDGSLTRIGTLQ